MLAIYGKLFLLIDVSDVKSVLGLEMTPLSEFAAKLIDDRSFIEHLKEENLMYYNPGITKKRKVKNYFQRRLLSWINSKRTRLKG
jgi:hypothetical protein